jgi:hypothetical protein
MEGPTSCHGCVTDCACRFSMTHVCSAGDGPRLCAMVPILRHRCARASRRHNLTREIPSPRIDAPCGAACRPCFHQPGTPRWPARSGLALDARILRRRAPGAWGAARRNDRGLRGFELLERPPVAPVESRHGPRRELSAHRLGSARVCRRLTLAGRPRARCRARSGCGRNRRGPEHVRRHALRSADAELAARLLRRRGCVGASHHDGCARRAATAWRRQRIVTIPRP